MECNRGLEIHSLFAKSVGQPGQPAHVKPSGSDQPLNVTGGCKAQVGMPVDCPDFLDDKLRGVVPALGVSRILVDVTLYKLREIHIRYKGSFKGPYVLPQRVAGGLHAVLDPAGNVSDARVCGSPIACAHRERRDELRICVYRAERSNIPKRRVIPGLDVALFLSDEPPNFVELQVTAREITHFLVHHHSTALPSPNVQPRNCVPMSARKPLNCPNAGPFRQCPDDCRLLILG